MKTVHGVYNLSGYAIYYEMDLNNPVYEAGNSPFDSQDFLDIDDPDAESLETIKRHCEATAREMAEETGRRFLGVDLCED